MFGTLYGSAMLDKETLRTTSAILNKGQDFWFSRRFGLLDQICQKNWSGLDQFCVGPRRFGPTVLMVGGRRHLHGRQQGGYTGGGTRVGGSRWVGGATRVGGSRWVGGATQEGGSMQLVGRRHSVGGNRWVRGGTLAGDSRWMGRGTQAAGSR